MSAAATGTVIIFSARLTVALVDESGDVAASFTLVSWHVIGIVLLGVFEASHFEGVLLWGVVDLVILKYAVIHLWS